MSAEKPETVSHPGVLAETRAAADHVRRADAHLESAERSLAGLGHAAAEPVDRARRKLNFAMRALEKAGQKKP